MTYRSVSTIEAALRMALNEHAPEKRDRATVELAMRYARAIDKDASLLAKLGPPLLAALEAMYMSPRVRTAVNKGSPSGPQPGSEATSRLDQLAERRTRKGPTTALDAPAT